MKHLDKSIQNKPGVYMITCKVNGKRYIGTSKNVRARISSHRSKSSCIALRNDIEKYGFFEAFETTILTYCDEKERFTLERFAIQTLLPEYNITGFTPGRNWYERHLQHQRLYNKRTNYAARYLNQLCFYNGEELTLNALSGRFRRAGIEHPFLEAKKYLLH